MPREYELMPKHDARKSFYGKARVRVDDYGNKALISYGTPVCWADMTGRIHRLWSGWSSTIGRHVKEFSLQVRNGERSDGLTAPGIDKAEWDAMEVEELPPFCK